MSDLEILDIPHSEIEPNPENPNAMDPRTLNALRDDIETRGFVQPVLVRPLERIAGEVKMHVADCPMTKADPKDRYVCTCQHYDNDPKLTPEGGIRYRIIDGEHRWKVLKEAGAKTIPCVIDDAGEDDARLRLLTMNRLRGEFVPVKLAKVLAKLASEMDEDELAKRLGMDADEYESLRAVETAGEDVDERLAASMLHESQRAPEVLTWRFAPEDAEQVDRAIQVQLDAGRESKADALIALLKQKAATEE